MTAPAVRIEKHDALWEITLDRPGNGRLEASGRDRDGNVEKVAHVWKLP